VPTNLGPDASLRSGHSFQRFRAPPCNKKAAPFRARLFDVVIALKRAAGWLPAWRGSLSACGVSAIFNILTGCGFVANAEIKIQAHGHSPL
jgi:hypothetical protein